ncbi:MAG TPA: GntR family transcriptional regulator [Pseudonocardiaceae bacterium]|nr:GntR family transcriptional regulator [Pseudonocardiaceae bacterium]
MPADPKHRQIADELRGQINRGELEPGDMLPSESALCEQYGVSRTTVRAALSALAHEGLVTSESGRGTFVRQRRHLTYRPQAEFCPHPASPEMDRFMTEHTAEGRRPSQTIDVAIVTPPKEVTRRLELDDDAVTVVRRRVRSLDGEPYFINDSYFPLGLVEGSEIMSPVDIARGASQVLAERGYGQVRALDEVYVRMPTPEEVHRLKLGPGTPVAVHIITGITAEGKPVRVVINVLPGDRHVIVWERQRPTPETSAE